MFAPIPKFDTVADNVDKPLTILCKLIVPKPDKVNAEEEPVNVFENANVEPLAALNVDALPKVTAPLKVLVPEEPISLIADVPANVIGLATLIAPLTSNAAPEATFTLPVPRALPLLMLIAPLLIVVPPV